MGPKASELNKEAISEFPSEKVAYYIVMAMEKAIQDGIDLGSNLQ